MKTLSLKILSLVAISACAPAYAQDAREEPYCLPMLEMQEAMEFGGFTPIFAGISDEYLGSVVLVYVNTEMFMIHVLLNGVECHADFGTQWGLQPPTPPGTES